MKKIFFSILAILPVLAFAQQINQQQAKNVAQNYLKQLSTEVVIKGQNLQLLEEKTTLIKGEEKSLYYIFKNEKSVSTNLDKQINGTTTLTEEKGFVIVSANKAVEPILGYSNNSKIHENPAERSPEFTYWMNEYEKQITDIIELDIKADNTISEKWQRLEKGEKYNAPSKSAGMAVNPLMTTKWDQGNPYNAQCPSSFFGGTAVTGCVATAMAQVMKYHNHPPQGEGYHSYNSNQYGTLSADYGATTYGWNSMTNQPQSSNSAIAKLMYHCGVSVNMNYSPQSSGAYVIESDAQNCSEKAFKEYFGYDATTLDGVRRQSYSNTQWTNLIRGEVEANRPVLYAGFGNGGGHAFVCDGVDNSNFFHFNWGWGGYEDGYFQLDALNPNIGGGSTTGAGNGGYNSGQQAVIGVKPAYGGNNGGGTPNPPSPDDDIFYGLQVYQALDISQNPIDFNQPFELYASIGNYGNSTVSGTFAALLYDEAGNQIATINPQDASIQGGFFEEFTFSTAGLTAIPGNYTIGVYFKENNTDWRLINPGDFINPGGVSIEGTNNDIRVYSEINVNPNPIELGSPFSITVDIANFASNGTFTGNISMDLYTLDGDYIAELDVESANLPAQTFNTFTFQNSGFTQLEPGTYLLVAWNQPTGQNWNIIGSTDEFRNPVYVNVATQGIQPDAYENNDSSSEAYLAVPNFSGNSGTFTTQGTNIHDSDDQDYFKIDLPAGSEYVISAEVKDSYNSGNTYTNDMLFAYKINNGEWSNTFDSSMPNLTLSNGETIYFACASYFVGKTGTYQFIAEVNGEAFTSNNFIEFNNEIELYPNPTEKDIILENIPKEATKITLFSIEGKLIIQQKMTNSSTLINLSNQSSGVYFIQFENNEGEIIAREKVVKQ